jgi:flagellar protein FliO/FliZ
MSHQMPGLNESLFASKNLNFAAAVIAFLAAAALLSLIFRFAFRRRVRLPRNGRARLPRLGTVDAFDLDRRRQLVIIRRDNVEHLLMIGGPNDIVIESEIIRAESRDPRDLREARIRDKELREKELREAPPLPAGISWPFPADAPPLNTPQRKMPVPPAAGLEPETGLTAAGSFEESMRDSAPAIVFPTPNRPVFSLPPRRMPPPVTPFGQGTSNPPEPLHGGAGPPQKPELGTNPAKRFPHPPAAPPFLRSPALRQVQRTAAKPPPSGQSGTPFGEALAPISLPRFEEIPTSPPGAAALQPEFSPAPATQSAGSAAPAVAASGSTLEVPAAGPVQDGTVSLEQEMARLLGRARG